MDASLMFFMSMHDSVYIDDDAQAWYFQLVRKSCGPALYSFSDVVLGVTTLVLFEACVVHLQTFS